MKNAKKIVAFGVLILSIMATVVPDDRVYASNSPVVEIEEWDEPIVEV